MAIKPILFNTEMVQAILDGRKTCTRRVVKTRRKDACGFYVTKRPDGSFTGIYEYDEDERMFENQLIPPYKLGDILYVRETWTRFECWNCEGDEEGNCAKDPHISVLEKQCGCYLYRATCEIGGDARWHSSIHMPKEAARIWLKVTNVRVERLQDITEDGAEAEGAIDNRGFIHSPENEYDRIYTAREHFIGIWDRTIKKSDLDRYGWDANPCVWVIEFERCEKPKEV